MGCVSSKKVVRSRSSENSVLSPTQPPLRKSHSSLHSKSGYGGKLEKIQEEEPENLEERNNESGQRHRHHRESRQSKTLRKGARSGRRPAFSLKFGRLTSGELIAAGWPAWLSAVAGEAVAGWLPLRSDRFERFEKIGQGTYSSVHRARDVETGKLVALKKVRFNNFKPESVRFMAREITILRRLDHPNIIKLEGIIASPLSSNIYLVFEYMEHDLAGLLSNPDIKFTNAQIKCYMWQLLCGMEHCHSQGVIHRDVKTSNILVNNEGILKIADFGLANFVSVKKKQPLTSRVVTLWYRPPELLLGSTNYEESVDLWSIGCVFAEFYAGRPLLKGRNEVEQLHKIFKLCGTPPEEYWKRCKLPLATIFKPQHPYESTLRERCKEFPRTAVNLIETFLSIEPHKRGTASSALDSDYFSTRPFACDPSSLPKHPPNKEIDAKFREDAARRNKVASRMRESGLSRNPRKVRKPLQESTTLCNMDDKIYFGRKGNGVDKYSKGGATMALGSLNSSFDTVSEASQGSQVTEISQGDSTHSMPLVAPSNGFLWERTQKQESASSSSYRKRTSRSRTFSDIDPTCVLHADNALESNRQQSHPNGHLSFDSSDFYLSEDSPADCDDQNARMGFSQPLMQSGGSGETQDNHTHQPVCKSRFYRDV